MNKPTVLVVEDDAAIRELITTTLQLQEYPYFAAGDGATALQIFDSEQPQVMLLDLGLPDMDGVEIITKVRHGSQMPIVVISARSEDADKIAALDAGADDYLTKPFSVEELLARLRVIQRRLAALGQQSSSVFRNGSLTVDQDAGCAYLGGQQLRLTPTEYKLLCLLARDVGKVLTHTYLTDKLWGSCWDSDMAALRVHMATLRKKLESDSDTSYIQTHVGIGYRMLKLEG